MAQSRGKKFEEKFRRNWAETVPDSMCYRLVDTMGGFKGICNAGDIIAYKYPICFIIDCKSTQSNTFPVNFRQYEEMEKYQGITGLHCGVVWWSIPNDKVIWIPFETFTKLKNDGKKSYNVKMLCDENYFSIDIPSTKLRTFMNSNYSSLVDYYSKGVK